MAGVRQFDEEAVFKKALTLFWQKGLEQATMQEIAAITGVQRGSLYNAYKTKETLFLQVFENHKRIFLSTLEATLADDDTQAALRNYFYFVIDSMTHREPPSPSRGCITTKTALGGDDLDGAVRHSIKGMLDGLQALLVTRLTNTPGLNTSVERAARMIMTYTRGLVVVERVYQDKQYLRDSADMFVDMLFANASQ